MQDHSSSFKFSTLSDLSAYLHGQVSRPQLMGEQLGTQSSIAIAPLQVLTSREHYQCCHIQCPSTAAGEFVPAILFEGHYYSLLKTERSAHNAFWIAARIMRPHRFIILTKIAKGYAIWISEPEAIPSPSFATKQKKLKQISPPCMETADTPKPGTSSERLPYKVLTAGDQYQLFSLQLPDTMESNVAVRVNEDYYRLFQRVETIRQAAKMAKLLSYYGERSVITKIPNGYGIWRLDMSIPQNELCTPYAKDQQFHHP